MAEGTILVVDDSAIVTHTLTHLFRSEGYTAVAANSGEDALAWLQKSTPDLVVTDILMPGMDGYELCRYIRAQPALRHTGVLALTVATELEAKLRGFEAGVDDFVGKETAAPELLARVHALLARRGHLDAGQGAADAGGLQRTQHVALFFSLKGGVGTSTLAVNVALLLAARRKETVGLLDLALEQGTTDILLDVVPRVSLGTLAADEVEPAALGPSEIRRLVTLHPGGVALMPAPRDSEDAERVSPDLTTAALEALAYAYGYVVVDAPSEYSEHTLRAIDLASLIVVVLSPDMASGKAAMGVLRVLRALDVPKEHVLLVLNSPNGDTGIPRESLEQALGISIDVVVPYDPAFIQALNEGKPRALREERRPTPSLLALQELAKKVDEKLTVVGPRAPAGRGR